MFASNAVDGSYPPTSRCWRAELISKSRYLLEFSKRQLLADFVEEVGFGGDFGALAFIMRFDGRAS